MNKITIVLKSIYRGTNGKGKTVHLPAGHNIVERKAEGNHQKF